MDVLCKVGCYQGDEQHGGANPVQHQVGVHPDVGGDFAVPVSRALQLIEAKFQAVLVVCPV